MKRYLPLLLVVLLLLPVLRAVMQDEAFKLDITGINASDLPEIIITTTVVDKSGQSVAGLGIQSFALAGSITDRAQIVRVQNITENDLPFAAVLVIDVSSSVAGKPFLRIQEAARLFVDSTGADDPMAIVTFSTDAQVVQDYTTDKAVLLSAIDNLEYGGKTALYDGAVLGVETAARAPVPRRAVVLLSDGAEFGRVSDSVRGDALLAAVNSGVPVYTIGLGFGTDRSYLRDMAQGTSARYAEAPAPEELAGIYSGLAQLFRSQYVVTLEFSDYDAIEDGGDTYDLTLLASAPQGVSNAASTIFRVPVPIPVISLPEGIFTAPITEATTLTPVVQADDLITSIEYTVNGTTTTGESLTIDPVQYAPGTYPLTITVTDETGDVTTIDTQFEIAALPPEVTLNWSPGDAPLTEAQTLSIDAGGQTPVVSANFVINTPAGDLAVPLVDENSDLDFAFDPFALAAGDYVLRVDATNAAGITTTVEQPFSVGAIAPRNLTVSGISAGQTIDAPVTIEAAADIQPGASLVSTTVTAGDTELPGLDLDPMQLQPGNTIVTVTVTDSSGATTSQDIAVIIAALPPIVELTAPESPVTAPVEAAVSVTSQTLLIGATYSLDGGSAVPLNQNNDGSIAPVEIDPERLDNGEHTLAVRIVNAGQQVTTAEVSFTVQLPTPVPTITPSPTIDATATAAELAAIAESTANAVATVNAEMTGAARATTDAQSTLNAQSTTSAEATQNALAQATQHVVSTQNALLTATVLQATQNAGATRTAVAAATQRSIDATQNAAATAEAQLTQNASATQDANAASTLQALETVDAQATVRAQRTLDAQSTAIARANADAFATATALAQSTQDSQATLDAGATRQALGTLTALAQATENAAATDAAATDAAGNGGATLTANAQATSEASDLTRTAAAEGTRNAAATLTAQPTVTPSPGPEVATLTATAVPGGSPPSASGGVDLNTLLPLCIIGLLILLSVIVVLFVRGRPASSNR